MRGLSAQGAAYRKLPEMPSLGRVCDVPLAVLRSISAQRKRAAGRGRCLESEQPDEVELTALPCGAHERSKSMSLNRAMVIGYLGQDPETRFLPSGQPVVGFSVATDESFIDKEDQKQERVEWHNIVAFARLGEICAEYL